MTTLVCGVGINDRSCPAKVNGKHTKEYSIWRSMLYRCYDIRILDTHPTYALCAVSGDFKYYHLFHKWCQRQIGFNTEDYDLDKDLLIKGNKLYSEDNCVFIPRSINSLLTKREILRGKYPIGVRLLGNRYQARCRANGEKCLGTYDTPELAFQAYKTFKEAYIKEQAELYKDSIDPRAYLALLNYEVSIND